MPEIVAENISIINSDDLEGTTRFDAEYYRPEYLNIERHLLNTANYKLWKDINGKFITGPFGSSFNVENYVSYSPYRYIRGKDIKDFFLLDDDNVYIPEKDFERLNKYALYEGDILISVVGTLGNAVIVDKNSIPAVFSCKSTAFRTTALNPFFLIAYLNCQFGRSLLQRKVRGAVQTGLNIDDLRLLPIYLPDTESQNKIAELVIAAKNNFDKSKIFYYQAEALLLEELGIKDIDLSHEPCYEVNSSDTIYANRIDAEYYQPKYERVIAAIRKQDHKEFWEIAFIDKTANPPYSMQREIPIITQKHLGQYQIDEEFLIDPEAEYTTLQFTKQYSKYVLQKEDILLYSVGAYIGKANIFNFDIKAVSGSFLTIIRADKSVIKPYYLLVVLNSLIGVNQSKRHSKATAQQYLYPTDIRKFIIPILNKTAQEKIGQLIIDANSARRQAKELLEEAKRKVEAMIEKECKIV